MEHGVHVQQHVEVEHNRDRVSVTALHLLMVETFVSDQEVK
jgi:hypothetical protein